MTLPNGNHHFMDQQLIVEAVKKLKGTIGLFLKTIEKWGCIDQKNTWIKCKEEMWEEYQKMLDGSTAFQTAESSGCGISFSATDAQHQLKQC